MEEEKNVLVPENTEEVNQALPEAEMPTESSQTPPETENISDTVSEKIPDVVPEAEVPDTKTAVPREPKKLPPKKLAICGAAVAALVAVILFCVYGLPAIRYSKGTKAFDSGDYSQAVEIFSTLEGYKDSDSYLKQATLAVNYAEAVDAYDSGNYSRAVEVFSTLKDYKDSKKYLSQAKLGVHYTNAAAKVQAGAYDEAIAEYKSAKNFQNAKQLLLETYTLKAESLFQSKQYPQAAEAFTEAGNSSRVLDCGIALIEEQKDYTAAVAVLEADTSDKAVLYKNYANAMLSMDSTDYQSAINFFAECSGLLDADTLKEKSTFLLAEKCLHEGYLNKAKTLYTTLPEDYADGDIVVADRIALLNKNQKFLDLVGSWNATDTYYRVQADSTTSSYYYYWYQDSIKLGTVKVTCPYNDADGTFTVKGTATYPSYQNFSSNSSKLKTEMETFSFSTTCTNTVPYQIGSSSTTKLSFSGNVFDLQYKYINKTSNVYWHYTFTSKVKYGNRTMLAEDR